VSKANQMQQNNAMKEVKYGVFALGSTQYPSFCAFGKKIDKLLQSCGATQVLPIGLGDDLRGQEQTFNTWGHECYTSSCEKFDINVNNEISITSFDEKAYDHQKVRVTEVFAETSEHQIHNELARLHRKKIISCKIITRVRLQSKQSERQTNLVRLSPSNHVSKNLFNYEPGDHLAVFPSNPKETVNALLGHLTRSGYSDPDSPIQLQRLIDGKWEADSRLPTCSLRVAFTRYLDINSPPSQRFLNYLTDMANDNWDSFRIGKLAKVFHSYLFIIYNNYTKIPCLIGYRRLREMDSL
jgi:nitric-oxide synthase